jgi:hypothetical protein
VRAVAFNNRIASVDPAHFCHRALAGAGFTMMRESVHGSNSEVVPSTGAGMLTRRTQGLDRFHPRPGPRFQPEALRRAISEQALFADPFRAFLPNLHIR